MKKSILVELIAALFILLFVYTAIDKLQHLVRFRVTLYKSPFPESLVPFISIFIPALELCLAALLFLPRMRRYGLMGTFVLMGMFTLYVGYMIMTSPILPCSCGGVISEMTWKQHLAFNAASTIVAFWAWLRHRVQRSEYKAIST